MDKTVKEQALRRLSIAGGHLKKIREMVEAEAYCFDVIHQSQAVQAALKKVDEIVLHGHLHTCVLKDIYGKKEKEKLIEEIIEVFRKKE